MGVTSECLTHLSARERLAWRAIRAESVLSPESKVLSPRHRRFETRISRITVLRGHSVECHDVQSAIAYLIEEEKSYRLREGGEQREAFEIQIRFNTGAKIEATFPKRAEAIAFHRSFA